MLALAPQCLSPLSLQSSWVMPGSQLHIRNHLHIKVSPLLEEPLFITSKPPHFRVFRTPSYLCPWSLLHIRVPRTPLLHIKVLRSPLTPVSSVPFHITVPWASSHQCNQSPLHNFPQRQSSPHISVSSKHPHISVLWTRVSLTWVSSKPPYTSVFTHATVLRDPFTTLSSVHSHTTVLRAPSHQCP